MSMGGRSSNKKDDTMTTPHADNLPGSGRADLTMVLLRSRELGFLGPGEVESHIRNATAFLPGIDQTLAERPLGDTGRFIMIDLGSGGGVPGLVLATLRPDLRIVLIDAAQRRTEFLNWAVDRLGIGTRVLVERGRAEDLARTDRLRGSAAVVTARSFAAPSATAECAVGFLTGVGARLLISEPPETDPDRWPAEPLAQMGLRLGEVWHQDGTTVQALDVVGPCPDLLPRRVGLPERRPLFSKGRP